MSISLTYPQKSLSPNLLRGGELGYVENRFVNLILTNGAVVIDHMAKLVELYKANEPIYGKITTGARAGSIARISRSSYGLHQGFSHHQHHEVAEQGYLQSDQRIWVQKFNDSWTQRVTYRLTLAEYLEFNEVATQDLILEFDGRKPIKANWNDQADMILLPDHKGGTHYVFTKKAKEVKEDNDLALTPLDMFGHPLAIGDMFIYARADELIFATLTRVSESGYITCQNLLEKRVNKLMGSGMIHSITNGLPIQAMMRFDKDVNLTQKLMMEKLAR